MGRLDIRLAIVQIVGNAVERCVVGENSSHERAKRCYNCGGFGHIAQDCPSENMGEQGTVCFNCGKRGHVAADCPEER